jgi:hypothetical protein
VRTAARRKSSAVMMNKTVIGFRHQLQDTVILMVMPDETSYPWPVRGNCSFNRLYLLCRKISTPIGMFLEAGNEVFARLSELVVIRLQRAHEFARQPIIMIRREYWKSASIKDFLGEHAIVLLGGMSEIT